LPREHLIQVDHEQIGHRIGMSQRPSTSAPVIAGKSPPLSQLVEQLGLRHYSDGTVSSCKLGAPTLRLRLEFSLQLT
jgi:hypothetical protein